MSQQNAQQAAESYLDYTAFSKPGLIKELVFEKYSKADATWAVDRITVNWNNQAAKAAENYLDFTSFSRSGLIKQLVFEGYPSTGRIWGEQDGPLGKNATTEIVEDGRATGAKRG